MPIRKAICPHPIPLPLPREREQKEPLRGTFFRFPERPERSSHGGSASRYTLSGAAFGDTLAIELWYESMPVSPADVQPSSVAGEQHIDGQRFPLVLENRNDAADLGAATLWITEQREWLDRQLSQHGAILLRGFPVVTPEDFDAVIQSFGYPNFEYEQSLSNAVRTVKTERVFSANEAPAEVTIFLHHEMAQTPIYPSRLFFFCQVAAETGGATPLCRSDLLYRKLVEQVPQFMADCETKGLKYTNVMPENDDPGSGMGRSWKSTWRAADRAAAEQRMRELGYSWEWIDDGSLRATTPVLPAVREIAPGRKSFFNQLIAAYQGWKDTRNDPSRAITLGDGQPLDRGAVLRAAELAEELTFDLSWRAGDVALVDNYVTMHGRRTFTGTRKVWASLVASQAEHSPSDR